ncbi:hypothetical protein ACP70R_044648 [Stipagrostis hirtigluma subsp. patula]
MVCKFSKHFEVVTCLDGFIIICSGWSADELFHVPCSDYNQSASGYVKALPVNDLAQLHLLLLQIPELSVSSMRNWGDADMSNLKSCVSMTWLTQLGAMPGVFWLRTPSSLSLIGMKGLVRSRGVRTKNAYPKEGFLQKLRNSIGVEIIKDSRRDFSGAPTDSELEDSELRAEDARNTNFDKGCKQCDLCSR